MSGIVRSGKWSSAIDGRVFAEEQCIVFVDMIGSTSLWEKIWKLERHISRNPEALSELTIKQECWESVRKIQNIVVETFVNGPKASCNFIKGLGDGFLFQSPNVNAAYDRAKTAEQKVIEQQQKLDLAALETLKTRVEEIAPSESLAEIPALCTSLLSALRGLSYRFIIHWTDEVIHGAFHMRNRTTGWDEGKAGLLAVVAETRKKPGNLKIKAPFYPDLFGHDMNYAARCMGVIKEEGIYLTQKALDNFGTNPKATSRAEDLLSLDWKTQIRAKGISGHVAFYKVTFNPNQNATIDHYMTKALVKRAARVATCDPTELFKRFTALIRRTNGSEEYELLRPHIFTAFFVTQPENYFVVLEPEKKEITEAEKAAASYTVLFRVEGPDQEYLESIITKVSNLIPSPPEADEFLFPAPVDTETTFIRTVMSTSQTGTKIGRWAGRGELKDSRPYFYVELSVEYFDDIDLIAENVIDNAKQFEKMERPTSRADAENVEFVLVELQRLWGKPAIYAVLKNQRLLNPDDIGSQANRVKSRVQEWSRNGRTLKKEPSITVQACTHFAAVALPQPKMRDTK